MTASPPNAIVLLSGGLDSATTLAIAVSRGFACHAISFDYGQRHRVELEASRRIARSLGAASHRVVTLDAASFRGSALTGEGEIPKTPRDQADRAEVRGESAIKSGIPATYVPARNLVFLSMALGLAESLGARDLFLGVNAVDYSGYPDCRPEFIDSFEMTANLATRAGVEGDRFRVHAPLIDWSKARIVAEGDRLGVDYELTISCYDPTPDGGACGECDSCILRRRGFADAGLPDPTRYAAGAR